MNRTDTVKPVPAVSGIPKLAMKIAGMAKLVLRRRLPVHDMKLFQRKESRGPLMESQIPRSSTACVIACLLLVQGAFAQEGNQPNPESVAGGLPVEVFDAPRPVSLGQPVYPVEDRRKNVEGWVNLNLMIDASGQPFEISVADSNGIKSLEEAALKAAKEWRFDPATMNGAPTEAAYEMKVTFHLSGEPSASSSFIAKYNALNKAIKSRDRAEADRIIEKISVLNLYEDAYFSLAQYRYAVVWGTQQQQLTWLKRAVAKEKKALFLSEDAFLVAVKTLFHLQTATQDFAAAMGSAAVIRSLTKDEKDLATVRAAVAAMEDVRAGERAYSVAGEISETSWTIGLFKKNFHIEVIEGNVEQLKLRCRSKYVFFDFNPDLEYRVADSAGNCWLELIGDPKTQFKLVQS